MNARLRYTGNDPQMEAADVFEPTAPELAATINALCGTVDHLAYYCGAEPIDKAAIVAALTGDDCEAGRLFRMYLMRCGSGDDAMKDCALELRRKFESETDYEGND